MNNLDSKELENRCSIEGRLGDEGRVRLREYIHRNRCRVGESSYKAAVENVVTVCPTCDPILMFS